MAARACRQPERISVDIRYGDAEGGQRTISRFTFSPIGDAAAPDGGWILAVGRHWHLARAAPR